MSSNSININSIETLGTHEGPGIRFVIFTQGCNYKCLYCHNPETQKQSSDGKISTDDLVEKILNYKTYFGKNGGVTVSGGEPLLQAEELIKLFSELKRLGIHTAIDTNGSILTEKSKELLDLTDLVLLDIKHIDEEWHKKTTGHSNKEPLKFANYLEDNNIKFWIRYVLVPGLTDQTEYLEQLQKHFTKYKSVERIEVLPYHTLGNKKYADLKMEYALTETPVPTAELITNTKNIFEKGFRKVIVR